MSAVLNDRDYRIVVGDLEVRDLHVEFRVEKTLKPQPNKAEVKVYNLGEVSRKRIEQFEEVPVQIDAGYRGDMSTIFLGKLRTGTTVRRGADFITLVSSGDGEKALRGSRSSGFHRPGVTPDAVLRNVARALGVGDGNLNQAVGLMKANQIGRVFNRGTVLLGYSHREMDEICRSFGLRWSVQGEKLQILEIKKALSDVAIELSADSGLVGSPSVDCKGVLRATMLMLPDVFPGRKVVLVGKHLQGQYVVECTSHQGAFREKQPWYVDIEAKRY